MIGSVKSMDEVDEGDYCKKEHTKCTITFKGKCKYYKNHPGDEHQCDKCGDIFK